MNYPNIDMETGAKIFETWEACPECGGEGTVEVPVRRGLFSRSDIEYGEVDCPECEGVGHLLIEEICRY